MHEEPLDKRAHSRTCHFFPSAMLLGEISSARHRSLRAYSSANFLLILNVHDHIFMNFSGQSSAAPAQKPIGALAA
jgi:hypothetical protein